MNCAVSAPFPRFYRVRVLLLERVDEVGDGVALRIGPEALLVVLDVRGGLGFELIHDVLGGHAVGNDHNVQDFVEHVRGLEALAEQILRAHLEITREEKKKRTMEKNCRADTARYWYFSEVSAEPSEVSNFQMAVEKDWK